MPAYIFIKTKVTDGELYMKYVEAAQPSLPQKYGRRFLVAEASSVEMLEREQPPHLVCKASGINGRAFTLLVSGMAVGLEQADKSLVLRGVRHGAKEPCA